MNNIKKYNMKVNKIKNVVVMFNRVNCDSEVSCDECRRKCINKTLLTEIRLQRQK